VLARDAAVLPHGAERKVASIAQVHDVLACATEDLRRLTGGEQVVRRDERFGLADMRTHVGTATDTHRNTTIAPLPCL
jgi:hypothetical protein